EPKRFYPQRELAGHVLGFVGEDGGQEGLERELDPQLRGKSVQVQATRDARGNMVLEHGAPDPSDLTGATVTLTLDSAIQLAAEKELAKAVRAAAAIGGWAVVLDVNTGAVLALAGNPAFDGNKPGRDPMVWRDRAVQDQLEPGSTIKSFVVARAIEERLLRPDELLYCEHGLWTHAGRKIHDTHPVDWATPATVLRESSNICAAKIGERLGKEKLIAGLRAFGVGEKTGGGLPRAGRGGPGGPPPHALDRGEHHRLRTGHERDGHPDGDRDGGDRERRRAAQAVPGREGGCPGRHRSALPRARGGPARAAGGDGPPGDRNARGGGAEGDRHPRRPRGPPGGGQDRHRAEGRSDPGRVRRQAALQLSGVRPGRGAAGSDPGRDRRAGRERRGGGGRDGRGSGVGSHRT